MYKKSRLRKIRAVACVTAAALLLGACAAPAGSAPAAQSSADTAAEAEGAAGAAAGSTAAENAAEAGAEESKAAENEAAAEAQPGLAGVAGVEQVYIVSGDKGKESVLHGRGLLSVSFHPALYLLLPSMGSIIF